MVGKVGAERRPLRQPADPGQRGGGGLEGAVGVRDVRDVEVLHGGRVVEIGAHVVDA